eukprot:163206-Chlamydomonas_euryale.AAC.8
MQLRGTGGLMRSSCSSITRRQLLADTPTREAGLATTTVTNLTTRSMLNELVTERWKTPPTRKATCPSLRHGYSHRTNVITWTCAKAGMHYAWGRSQGLPASGRTLHSHQSVRLDSMSPFINMC